MYGRSPALSARKTADAILRPIARGCNRLAADAARIFYEFLETAQGQFFSSALIDPVVADLVLAETNPDAFTSPLAERAFLVLLWWSELDPIRFATEAGADLVREELGEEVDYLIADRPALRQARAALRAAVGEIGRVQDEPLVQLAAAELEVELASP